jgi:hypothetical protein
VTGAGQVTDVARLLKLPPEFIIDIEVVLNFAIGVGGRPLPNSDQNHYIPAAND